VCETVCLLTYTHSPHSSSNSKQYCLVQYCLVGRDHEFTTHFDVSGAPCNLSYLLTCLSRKMSDVTKSETVLLLFSVYISVMFSCCLLYSSVFFMFLYYLYLLLLCCLIWRNKE